jgi:hypothetical protein
MSSLGGVVGVRLRTQIGMFRPIRMDHTNCLQVAIKSIHSFIVRVRLYVIYCAFV